MTTYSFQNFPDFVAYELLTYVDTNYLKGNLQYWAEDVLGNITSLPANNDKIASFIMNNAGSDGGTWYFDGGTSKYIQADATNAYLKVIGIDLKMGGTTLIKGDRSIICSNSIGVGVSNAQYAIGSASFNRVGHVMKRDGSLMGIGFNFLTTAFTSSGTSRATIRKNGASFATSNAVTINANNTVFASFITFARGVNTFSAGDTLDPYFEYGSGTYTVRCAFAAEVIYNT